MASARNGLLLLLPPLQTRALIGLMSTDGTSGRCTEPAMVTRVVSCSAADERTLETPFRLGRHSSRQRQSKHCARCNSFHDPISSLLTRAMGSRVKGSAQRLQPR